MMDQAFLDCNAGGLEIDEDICNSFDEVLNGYDHDPTSRETTGRWTREEHLTFIKGLELYGKGWKKIASLIKTRTVVQIRTHAQKYFLKLSKARQTTSDSSNGFDNKSCGQNGIRKRRQRRKRFCRLTSVTPVLHPFIKVSSSANATIDADPTNPTIDADRTLYHFLTPMIGELTTHQKVISAEGVMEDAGNSEDGERSVVDKGGKGLESDNCTVVRIATVEKLTLTAHDRKLPEWYSKCEHVSALLKRADNLNWLEDSFTAIRVPEPPIKTNLKSASNDTMITAHSSHNMTVIQSNQASIRPHASVQQKYSRKTSSTVSSLNDLSTDDADYSNNSDSCGDDESGSGCTDGESQPRKKHRSWPSSTASSDRLAMNARSTERLDASGRSSDDVGLDWTCFDDSSFGVPLTF